MEFKNPASCTESTELQKTLNKKVDKFFTMTYAKFRENRDYLSFKDKKIGTTYVENYLLDSIGLPGMDILYELDALKVLAGGEKTVFTLRYHNMGECYLGGNTAYHMMIIGQNKSQYEIKYGKKTNYEFQYLIDGIIQENFDLQHIGNEVSLMLHQIRLDRQK